MRNTDKAQGAFLTIGELAAELGLPQHILRYWETRFPQLRPMQRSGNRRYYRPEDAALARRIHYLLNVRGYTLKGAAKALAEKEAVPDAVTVRPLGAAPAAPQAKPGVDSAAVIAALKDIRARLAAALDA